VTVILDSAVGYIMERVRLHHSTLLTVYPCSCSWKVSCILYQPKLTRVRPVSFCQVDIVILGAEGVLESGGIVNKVSRSS
jgi:hypothetical protein